MAWSTPPAWAVGDTVTEAKLDIISDDLNVLRTPPCCRVYNNATISNTTSAVYQAVTFNSERYDTDTMHTTGGSNNRITFTTAGKYSIGATIFFASNGTGDRSCQFRINGTLLIAEQTFRAAGGTQSTVNLSCDYQAAAADYVEVLAYQSSGGALNMTVIPNEAPEFWAHWISA